MYITALKFARGATVQRDSRIVTALRSRTKVPISDMRLKKKQPTVPMIVDIVT